MGFAPNSFNMFLFSCRDIIVYDEGIVNRGLQIFGFYDKLVRANNRMGNFGRPQSGGL